MPHSHHRAALLAAALAILTLTSSHRAQDVEAELKDFAREVWAKAEESTRLLGSEGKICLFPLITPPRGYKSAVATKASDKILEEILRSTAPAPFRGRIQSGRELAALLSNRGAHPSALTHEMHTASLLGSIADASYVICGSFVKEPSGTMKIVFYGLIPGLDQASYDMRPYEIPAAIADRDRFALDLIKASKYNTESGFDVGFGAVPPTSLPVAGDLLGYVLEHRFKSYQRHAHQQPGIVQDGIAFMLPMRRAGDGALSRLSKTLEGGFHAAIGSKAIACERLDKFLSFHDDGLAAYAETEDNVVPEMLEKISQENQGGRPIFGSTRGDYGINGNKLSVSLWLVPGIGDGLEYVEPFQFDIEYAALIDVIKAHDRSDSPYAFEERKLSGRTEVDRLMRFALADLVRKKPDVFRGKRIYVSPPAIPAMAPANSFVQGVSAAVMEKRVELLNRARADAETWPRPDEILVKASPVQVVGRVFDSWNGAHSWLRELIEDTKLEKSTQYQTQLQENVNSALEEILIEQDIEYESIDGGDVAEKMDALGSIIDSQSPVSSDLEDDLSEDEDIPAVSVLVFLRERGETAYDVLVKVRRDGPKKKTLALSKPLKVKKAYVGDSLAELSTPSQARNWEPPAKSARLWHGVDLRLVYRYVQVITE